MAKISNFRIGLFVLSALVLMTVMLFTATYSSGLMLLTTEQNLVFFPNRLLLFLRF